MAEPLQVRVSDELMLDAGSCETALGSSGPKRLIRLAIGIRQASHPNSSAKPKSE